MSWFSYRPYVSVAQRRAEAAKEMSKLAKKGQVISPVRLTGKKIASTFWGKAWCEHLESYSDFDNRLPRGRTYVRNGSVVNLQIKPGQITAVVSGSSLYDVQINIDPLKNKTWEALKQRCAGQIGSMIELLRGRLSDQVMKIITERDQGLFPAPVEIKKSCSCPDWADMCKHVAAVLYGVGNRLDHEPQLLFTLRQVDHLELIAKATDISAITGGTRKQKTVATSDLADVFGIELDAGEAAGSEMAAGETVTSKRPKPRKDITPAPSPAIVITTTEPPRRSNSVLHVLVMPEAKKKKKKKAAKKKQQSAKIVLIRRAGTAKEELSETKPSRRKVKPGKLQASPA